MTNDNLLSIGEVATRTGLRPSAIRYYESAGVLPVPMRSNGQRRYEAAIVKQIGFIQNAQNAGFSIEEMKLLVGGATHPQPYGERVQCLAHRKLEELQSVIDSAQAMKRRIEAVLSCHCDHLSNCTLFTPCKHE